MNISEAGARIAQDNAQMFGLLQEAQESQNKFMKTLAVMNIEGQVPDGGSDPNPMTNGTSIGSLVDVRV